ncbi:MAG: hypothetical protein C4550_03605 [Nitrospiraceae bacterium]|nr:MAG: hypothetical protein C4550_03605 [Nitrospiraceae bacterium]
MASELHKAFEKLIDKTCYNTIYNAVSAYIDDNYRRLDLAERSNFIEEVQEASLDDLQILRISNIEQDDDIVKFDVIVNCEIVIEETVRRDRQVDSASQWFTVSCSAILDDVLKNFKIDAIDIYNR